MEKEAAQNGTEIPDDAGDETRTSITEAAESRKEDHDESGWVTTDVAAAALGRSPRRVREYIRRGKLAAITEGEGVSKRWLVSTDSLDGLLDEIGQTGDTRSNTRTSFAHRPRSDRDTGKVEDAAVVGADELLATVQELQYRLGRAEARVEIAEMAESALREERERLLADLKEERERADRIQEELLQARRGWLRRFFGF